MIPHQDELPSSISLVIGCISRLGILLAGDSLDSSGNVVRKVFRLSRFCAIGFVGDGETIQIVAGLLRPSRSSWLNLGTQQAGSPRDLLNRIEDVSHSAYEKACSCRAENPGFTALVAGYDREGAIQAGAPRLRSSSELDLPEMMRR